MESIKRFFGLVKTPTQLVDRMHFEFRVMDGEETTEKPRKILRRFTQMRDYLIGAHTKTPNLDKCEELAKATIETHLTLKVLEHFTKLDLEERKMYVTVFSILVTSDYGKFATVYMMSAEGSQILKLILDGYGNSQIALNCGIMIRECIKQRCIHEYLLDNSNLIEPLFTVYAHSPTFEISSDAFSTIQTLMRRNKQLVSKKMNANGPLYGRVFGWFNNMINSKEYVTRRMALQLLNEFLLDKVNFDIMIAYVGDVKNLMGIMTVLRTPQAIIQYEAFHVFKVFVANPDKTPQITLILQQNADKLINYLTNFLPERDNEQQFVEEKKLLINMLKKLKSQDDDCILNHCDCLFRDFHCIPRVFRVDSVIRVLI